MTAGTRTGLTRFTLSTVVTTSALGAVLIAFACGDNGATNTPPATTDDLAWTGGAADMTTTGDSSTPGIQAPTLTAVAPKLVSTAGGTSVTLTGTNFRPGATVMLGTVTVLTTDTTVSADGNSITIKVPARLAMAGKVDVTITNPDAQSTTSTGALTYYFAQVTFAAAQPVVTDIGPRCIIVADLNKDNKLDLVTANFNKSTVNVYLGDGTGKFPTNAANRGTGTGPYTVAVGDINNDTFLDVISANQSGSLSVMTGDGTGNLNSPVAYNNTTLIPAGSLPQSVAIVDVNNDNKMDLVVNLFGKQMDNVALVMGNNNASFNGTGSTTITANGGNLYSLIADDVNKDGKLDVIGVHQTTSAVNVSPLINLKSATAPFFTIGANKSLGSSPTAVVTGDFDNDGNKDLAVVNQLGNNVSFLKGSGATGTFTDTAANGTTAVGMGPEHLAALDVNQDGNLDLVVANYTSGNVSLLLGKGDGTFMTATTINVGTGVKPNWVAVGDFNKDGRVDLAVTDYNTTATVSGQIMILLNTSQ